MLQGYGRGKLEFYLVAIIIALIVLFAVNRYTLMTKDARILRLEIISHNFMTAAVNLRIEFLISRISHTSDHLNNMLMVDSKYVYVSAQGWPASTMAPVNDDFQPNDNDCYQLWQILFQNPEQITAGQFAPKSGKYRAFAFFGRCRYALNDGEAYFDYFPLTGKLLFSVSRH